MKYQYELKLKIKDVDESFIFYSDHRIKDFEFRDKPVITFFRRELVSSPKNDEGLEFLKDIFGIK